MTNRTMVMDVVDNTHNLLDVLHINYERWIVVQTHYTGRSYKIWLEPLADYLAKHTFISEAPYEMTIAEYIDKLCDKYESDCAC